MLYTIQFDIPTIKETSAIVRGFIHSLDKQLFHLETHLFSTLGLPFWKLWYLCTHQCGSRAVGHTPVYGNNHNWLWLSSNGLHTCSVCGERVQESDHLNRVTTYSRDGRAEDIKQLQTSLKTATNEVERTAVKHALYKITHEDTRTRSMRESLIHATRNGDHEQIKDIHSYIEKKQVYHND